MNAWLRFIFCRSVCSVCNASHSVLLELWLLFKNCVTTGYAQAPPVSLSPPAPTSAPATMRPAVETTEPEPETDRMGGDWEMHQSPAGQKYYFNPVTNESKWTMPLGGITTAKAAGAAWLKKTRKVKIRQRVVSETTKAAHSGSDSITTDDRITRSVAPAEADVSKIQAPRSHTRLCPFKCMNSRFHGLQHFVSSTCNNSVFHHQL